MKKLSIILSIFFSFLFYSCSKNNPVNSNDGNQNHPPTTAAGIAFQDNTKILSANETSDITSITDTSITFFPTDDTINNIKTGDVIVAGVSANTPGGFLRKVTHVTSGSGNSSAKLIITQMAALGDLIKSGKVFFSGRVLSANQSLNQILYDLDNDTATTNDQVGLAGSINETGDLSGYFVFNGSSSVSAEINFNLAGTADLNLNGDLNSNLNVIHDFVRTTLNPIVIYSDPPIVITPVFHLYAVLEGNAQGKFSSGATQNFQTNISITYNGGWTFKPGLGDTFLFKNAEINFSSSLKLSLGSSINFKVYEIAGPSVCIEPYIQLNSNLSQSPSWVLYDGDNATTGINTSWLSNLVPGQTWTFSSDKSELSQAQ